MSNDPLRIFEPGFGDDTTARYQQQARALIDAWRDEWHLEPEPEMDNGTSQVYESLVNYVASALAAAPVSTVASQELSETDTCLCGHSRWDHWGWGNFACSHGDCAKFVSPASPAALRDEAEDDRPTAEPRYGERTCKHCDKPIKNTPRRPNRWTHVDTASIFCETEDLLDNEVVDKELRRWQDAIRDKMISMGVPDSKIDGAGCDSSDPLDFTLAEVGQGVGYFLDQLEEPRSATTPPSTAATAAAKIADQLIPHLDHAFLLTKGWREQIASIIERCLSSE